MKSVSELGFYRYIQNFMVPESPHLQNIYIFVWPFHQIADMLYLDGVPKTKWNNTMNVELTKLGSEACWKWCRSIINCRHQYY
jgi:hypothetical protein